MKVRTAQSPCDARVPEAIFELTADGFVIIGKRGEILRMNPSAERMFGYESSQIAGQSVERILPAAPANLIEPTALHRHTDRQPHVVCRARGRNSDGCYFPLEITLDRIAAQPEPLFLLCARRPGWTRPGREGSAASAARIGGFGYWDLHLAGPTILLSDEIREILGVDPKTTPIAPSDYIDYIHPDDLERVRRAIESSLATGERLDVTHGIITGSGDQRVVRSVAEVRRDPRGAPIEVLGVTLDVTEHERVSEALRKSENTLSAIVNSTTAMIYIKDVEGKYLLVNRHFEEVFGVDNEELRGKSDYSFLPGEVADSVRANDAKVRQTGCPVEFEEVVPHQGEEHVYISIKFPLRHSNGEVYAVCGISTDITERKRAQAELEQTKRSLERLVDERTATLRETNRRLQEEIAEHKETASQLQRLIDTAREGIWAIDETGRTSFANPRIGEILGYDAAEMIGKPMFDFMAEERRREAAQNLERRRQGISEDQDFEFLRKDGSRVWTLLSTSPVADKHGKIIGALAMVTDITERKRAEEHQALLLQELDHRVKNILATVVALSEKTMAGAGTIAEFTKTFAGRIQAMARTHEALARAKWQEVPLQELAGLVLAPFQMESTWRVAIEGESVCIPPHAITPLSLILNELGTNALKHGALCSDRGAVRLAWKAERDGGLSLLWQESGGPPVTRSRSEGTGLQLIRGLIEYELCGSLDLEFAPAGLVCRAKIPLSASA